ncbi:MAG: hypothetical protein WC600_17345 [Desulfobaccales bacterium]
MPVRSPLHVILTGLLVLIGTFLIFYITRQGIGISPDSLTYICSANNLFNGKGLCTLSAEGDLITMTHYPPFYPALIAFGQFMGLDALTFCKALNIIIFGLNIILFGLILYKSTEGNVWASFLGSLFLIVSYDIVRIHLCAMTDPIFIFFALSGFYTLTLYIDYESNSYLIISSLLISCALLARYVGLSLIITAIVAIAILTKKNLKDKIYDCLIFVIISATPLSLWLIRNIYLTGNPFNRSFGYRDISISSIPHALNNILANITSLTLLIHLSFMLTLILLSIFIYLLLTKYDKLNEKSFYKFRTMPIVMILFTLIYLLFVIFSLFFFDSAIYIGYRILSPIIISTIFLTIYCLSKCVDNKKLIAICSILILVQIFRFDVNRIYGRELVFSGSQWKKSDIINKVKMLPEHILIYSNGYDAIYFLTGKIAFSTPEELIDDKNEINVNKDSQLESIANQFDSKGAILVWFNNIDWRGYLVSKDDLISKLNLVKLYQGGDGAIYTTKNYLNEFNGKSK